MSAYTPRRWSDEARPGEPEGEAGRLLREARALEGPSAVGLAHIRQRVEARVEGGQGARWYLLGRGWTKKGLVSLLAGAAALASVGTVVGVAVVRAVRPKPPRVEREAPPPGGPAVVAPEVEVPQLEVPPPGEALVPSRGEVAPGLEPQLEGKAPRQRRVTKAGSKAAAVERAEPLPPLPTTAAPEANTLGEESALLAQALRQQRQEKDPAAALATLEAYRRQYPRGALREEAAAAELQALLSLGRHGEALALLERLEAAAHGTPARLAELRLVHAEVLAKAGRCGEAVPYFDEALTRASAGVLQERALFGRATCRGAQGDAAGQRADLERYLAAFPAGRFAAQARAQLGR